MSEKPKIGLVTVTYNSADVLEGFMSSLLAQSYSNWLLCSVDNASKDQTLQELGSYKDSRIKVVANSQNVGVAEGNNQGIREALALGCEYVLLINNDVEFGPDLIQLLLANLINLKADMVAPKMYYYEPKNRIWFAGGGFYWWLPWRNFHYGMNQQERNQFNSPMQIKYAPTCCLMVHKDVFARVGFMDEKYFVYFDDCDFFYRCNQNNISAFYIPDATLLHKVSSLSGSSPSGFSGYIQARNAVYFSGKFFKGLKFLYSVFSQQILYVFKTLIYRRDLSGFMNQQRGLRDGWRMSSTNGRIK